MTVRLDHVVLGVPDLAAATRALERARVAVEPGWAQVPQRPAVRVAGPDGAVLMLVEGDELELALVAGDGRDPVAVLPAGEAYEESWLAPGGERVAVRGRRDGTTHGAI
ncbi:MAG: hypothetical protein ACI379_00340, partial [Nocardioides sp.]|uniref:hypothetical protein n=1 Tax=Nocardioides sp. TaxID=35761 RepID=UPI003F11580A